jgi:Flp pilus assembly protein TadB
MSYLSLLFIFTSFYSIFNFQRLKSSASTRFYKSKFQVYCDLLFYSIEFFYFIWLVLVAIFNLKSSLILILLTFLSWMFLKSKNQKNNFIYQVLKIIGLTLILLQIKTF